MDPNATLKELVEFFHGAAEPEGNGTDPSISDVSEMAEKFLALNIWLSRGGFLPATWQKGRVDLDQLDIEKVAAAYHGHLKKTASYCSWEEQSTTYRAAATTAMEQLLDHIRFNPERFAKPVKPPFDIEKFRELVTSARGLTGPVNARNAIAYIVEYLDDICGKFWVKGPLDEPPRDRQKVVLPPPCPPQSRD